MYKKTSVLTFSALVVAIYIAVMFVTQGFAFGPYQIRIATGLYSLTYLFPFLVIPLALANSLSNVLMGGLGPLDIFGGLFVGLITGGLVYLVRRWKLPMELIILPVIFGPGLIVPLWLSPLTGLPYWALVLSLSIGQVTPAILGYLLIRTLGKISKARKDAPFANLVDLDEKTEKTQKGESQ